MSSFLDMKERSLLNLNFWQERGINSNLALLIPDLAEWKEEREYRSWLSGVKKFVDAA